MPPVSSFSGFGEAAQPFLAKLRRNNRREWFQPRKQEYEAVVQQPMIDLVLAVERELRGKLPLQTKSKGIVSRIYRDIRFREDKTPYNTFVSGTLHRNGKKDEPGAVYIHFGDTERYLAAGFWQPERPLLNQWRLRMCAAPEHFLALVKQLKRNKLALSDEHALQRMPRGFENFADGPLADYLRLQSFVVVVPMEAEAFRSAKVVRTITAFALAAAPLLEFGWSLPRVKPQVFAE